MAKTTSDTPAAETSGIVEQLTKALVDATNANGPIKQVPITRYKGKTPWNPTGAREAKRTKFTREYWQNGSVIQRWHVTDDDVELLNQLQPGRFLERRVEIVAGTSADGELPTALEIRYNNKSSDQRFDNKNYWVNFSDLLRKLVAEIAQGSAREVA